MQTCDRNGRSLAVVDQATCWPTGHDAKSLSEQIAAKTGLAGVFAQAPASNPDAAKITDVACGIRVESIGNPLMQKFRFLDKLVDELANGKAMAKSMRVGRRSAGVGVERGTAGPCGW
ncbi:MAG: DUF2200 family protein [Planctomycetota bacterium]